MDAAALDRFFSSLPPLLSGKDHRPGEPDVPVGWGIARPTLQYLINTVRPEFLRQVTGAGNSTPAFALAESERYCISPPETEHRRIRDHCRAEGISTDRIHFIARPSERYPPAMTPRDSWTSL